MFLDEKNNGRGRMACPGPAQAPCVVRLEPLPPAPRQRVPDPSLEQRPWKSTASIPRARSALEFLSFI